MITRKAMKSDTAEMYHAPNQTREKSSEIFRKKPASDISANAAGPDQEQSSELAEWIAHHGELVAVSQFKQQHA